MKRILKAGVVLAMILAMSVQVFAMEVPEKVTVQNLNGVQLYIKEFTVSNITDPESLMALETDLHMHT